MKGPHPLLLPVNLFRGFQLGLRYFNRFSVLFHGTEKAGSVTFVAGRPGLFDLDEQDIAVTIEGNVPNLLHVPAGLAFHPEFLARPAPEVRLAGGDGLFQGGAVHPRHHQDAPGFLFLDNGGNQAVVVKFQLVVKILVLSILAQISRDKS
jgi:hypothetical protein